MSQSNQSDDIEREFWGEGSLASDPFAAQSSEVQGPAKPVVEIIQNLGGYCTPDKIVSSQVVVLKSKPSRIMSQDNSHQLPSGTHNVAQSKLEMKPISPRFKVTSVSQVGQLLDSSTFSVKAPAAERSKDDFHPLASESSDSSALKMDSWKTDNSLFSLPPTPNFVDISAARFVAKLVPDDEPPVDIREFAPQQASPEPLALPDPEPIPGAYQFEPDYFEHHPTQRHLNQLDALDRELAELLAVLKTDFPEQSTGQSQALEHPQTQQPFHASEQALVQEQDQERDWAATESQEASEERNQEPALVQQSEQELHLEQFQEQYRTLHQEPALEQGFEQSSVSVLEQDFEQDSEFALEHDFEREPEFSLDPDFEPKPEFALQQTLEREPDLAMQPAHEQESELLTLRQYQEQYRKLQEVLALEHGPELEFEPESQSTSEPSPELVQELERLWVRETAEADNSHQDAALAAVPSVAPPPTELGARENEQDELAGVIYAQDRQVIRVNGNDGYQYIDMTCFDIKQASFQGNRIHIRNGVQEFEIEYENITHVLFANGQQVELASCDNDYF